MRLSLHDKRRDHFRRAFCLLYRFTITVRKAGTLFLLRGGIPLRCFGSPGTVGEMRREFGLLRSRSRDARIGPEQR